MRLALVALAVLTPALGAANVTRPASRDDVVLSFAIAGSATGAKFASLTLPWAATIAKVTVVTASTASGGGAGTTLFRFTDGTNACDAALLCTDSQNTNTAYTLTPTGACSWVKGAALTASIVSSTCTSTQPSLRNVVATGIIYR